jgi:hypothetical protein
MKRLLELTILDYLKDNPEASDAVEGVADVWLREQLIEHSLKEVEKALARLVAAKLVQKRVGPDSRNHFGLNREKLPEIQRLLGNSGGPSRASTGSPPGRKRKKSRKR